jgi:protein-S-isoprenylcysteine O-methyltransferase Ste14
MKGARRICCYLQRVVKLYCVTLVKTLLFTILVPGTVTVLVPYLLLPAGGGYSRAELWNFLGLIAIVFGAAIYFWCARDFTFTGKGTPAPYDPPKVMVARGLYRIVRNPMYVGVSLVLLGEALFFASSKLFIYGLLVLLGFHLRVICYEEPTLRKKFGENYSGYCRQVPRWIPRWPRRNNE